MSVTSLFHRHWADNPDFTVVLGSLANDNFAGYITGDYRVAAQVESLPVPEPATLGLLVMGGLIAGGMGLRRRM